MASGQDSTPRGEGEDRRRPPAGRILLFIRHLFDRFVDRVRDRLAFLVGHRAAVLFLLILVHHGALLLEDLRALLVVDDGALPLLDRLALLPNTVRHFSSSVAVHSLRNVVERSACVHFSPKTVLHFWMLRTEHSPGNFSLASSILEPKKIIFASPELAFNACGTYMF